MNSPSEISIGRSDGQLRWAGIAFRRATLMASLLVTAIYISSVAFNRIWCFDLLTPFRVQLALAMVPLAIAQLLARRTAWGLAFAFFSASAAWSVVCIVIPVDQPERGRTILRIMSANVLASNSDVDTFERLVADVDPDILAILEYTRVWDSELASIRATYPHSIRQPRSHGFGIALFSKYPIQDAQAVSLLKYFDGPALFCDVEVDGQTLSIVAVHTISPLSSLRFDSRNSQLSNLAQRIVEDVRPRIVLGDINATTWSPFVLDLMRKGQLRDSRQGFGLLQSWPQFAWPLLITIDHAFVSRHVHVHRRWVERDIGSDHFPIVVEISLTPKPISAM